MKKLNALTLLVCAVSLTVAITACDDSESDETTAGETTAGEMNTEEMKAEITQKAYEWLMGHFDSSAQASAQPSYFSIQLLSSDIPHINFHF